MARFTTISILMILGATPVLAGPADLLKQAIEENNDAKPAAKADVQSILSEADRLAAQKQWDEAIALYEKAYRAAPSDSNNYVRLLIAKQSAGRMTEADRQGLALLQEEEAASIDQVFRSVRLDFLQARQALRSAELGVATVKLEHAGATLESLPRHVDTKPYQRELTTLRHALRKRSAAADAAGDRESPPALSEVDWAGEAVSPIRPDDADAMAEVHVYDKALDAAIRRNRVDWLISNREAAMAPLSDMSFPADWAERTAKRAKYRDGVIYESQPFTGPDGQTYTTAIYDLGDLVHPVPNFYAAYPGSAQEQRMQSLDRQYLRERSQIFNGYADDLAAGLPLLHFFGGIDNNAISQRTDPVETERVMQTIQAFIQSR